MLIKPNTASRLPRILHRDALCLVRSMPRNDLFVPDYMTPPKDPGEIPRLPTLSERLSSWSILRPLVDHIPQPTKGPSDPLAFTIPKALLSNLIKQRARTPALDGRKQMLQTHFDDYSQLRKFLNLSRCTSVCITSPSMVRVELSTQQDTVDKKIWFYRVRLSLLPESPHASLQCTHRSWRWEDADGTTLTSISRATGLVGAQPVLTRGGPVFEYMSLVPLDLQARQPFTMAGELHFENDIVTARVERTLMLAVRSNLI